MLTVPVLRPEVAREYEEYQAAVDEYNRRRMEEMRKPVPGAPVCLAYAHAAPRCAHVRADGTRCAAPALRGRRICYAHTRMLVARKAGLQLPALEDAGGIALAAMQVVQQMLDGKLPRRKAATALYGIQIVASTLNHRPFAVQPTSVVMDAAGLPPEEELLESEGVSQTTVTPGQEANTGEQETNLPDARKENSLDGGAIDGAVAEAPSQEREFAEGCEEACPRVPVEDRGPSLRSGLVNNEDRDPSLRSGFETQSPLGKEWWEDWEKKVRAIASGAENAKEPQGVKEGDLHEEGVG